MENHPLILVAEGHLPDSDWLEQEHRQGRIVFFTKRIQTFTRRLRLLERSQFNLEEALREGARRFRLLIEGVSPTLLKATADGRLKVVNSAGEELRGYGPDELLAEIADSLRSQQIGRA